MPFTSRKYFQRLLAGLLIFIFILYLPFSVLLQRSARKIILNNITSSNQAVLEQLKKNYNSFADNINSLTASIFWRNDIQILLYSQNPSHEEIYYTLSELYSTFVVSHPTLQSICLYNKHNGELYTVTASGTIQKAEFLDFVSAQDSIQPLRPVLHSLTLQSGSMEAPSMIFSHFMYQFHDPSDANESFLVLNQYASHSVSTIDTSSETSVPTCTYYVTRTADVASRPQMPEVQQAHDQLLERFRAKQASLDAESGTYTDEVQGKQYLMSYTHTVSQEDALVIIQDYDAVFANLDLLARSFLLISVVFLLFALGLAVLISRQLYRPIDNMLGFFSRQSGDPTALTSSRRINELDIIQNIYQTTSEESRKLKDRESLYRPIALQYGLSSMLLKNDTRSIEQFRRANPDHWLTLQPDGPLAAMLVQPQPLHPEIEAPDALLLYGVQNITEELLEPRFLCSCFQYSAGQLCFVLRPRSEQDLSELEHIMKQAGAVLTEHFSMVLAVGVSRCGSSLGDLSALLEQASVSLSYTFLFGPCVVFRDQIQSNEENTQTTYSAQLNTQLEAAILRQDPEECGQALDAIKAELCRLHIKNATSCIIALLNHVCKALDELLQGTFFTEQSATLRAIYGCISDSASIDQCFRQILRSVSACFTDQEQDMTMSSELFVSTVQQFVQSAISDKGLSSKMISDYLGYAPRYLMKKFKTLTGVALNEYITDQRMEQAAELLRDTDLPVNAISQQIGMDHVSYFYRLFKKKYDCTPSEYREVCAAMQEHQEERRQEI